MAWKKGDAPLAERRLQEAAEGWRRLLGSAGTGPLAGKRVAVDGPHVQHRDGWKRFGGGELSDVAVGVVAQPAVRAAMTRAKTSKQLSS